MINSADYLTAFENRLRAAFSHLLASLLVIGAVIGLAAWTWFPPEFFSATGVIKIMLLIIIVDACLGPVLTLSVYNKKKPELKRDLLIILAIQLSGLTYGVYTLASARTAFVVFAVDRFELVQANDLSKKNLANADKDEYKRAPWFGPKWISTSLPDQSESMQTAVGAITGGADIAQLPKLYRDLSTVTADIIERSKPLDELKSMSAKAKKQLSEIKETNPSTKLAYLPLTARKKDLSVIIDKKNATILGIIDADPW